MTSAKITSLHLGDQFFLHKSSASEIEEKLQGVLSREPNHILTYC